MSINCREVREMSERGDTSFPEETKKHIESCPDCRAVVDVDSRIGSTLRNLPEHEVPANFNQEVRSRISEGTRSSDWGPWVGVAVPAAAVCLIAFYVLMNPGFYSEGPSPTDVATVQPDETITVPVEREIQANPTDPEVKEVSEVDSGADIAQVQSDSDVIPEKPEVIEAPSRSEKTDDAAPKEQIFSKDLTAKEPEITLPPGLDGNPVKKNTSESRTFSATEILQPLGITSVPASSGRRVTAIVKNSLAEKAGIRVGDVVVALDGKSIGKPLVAGTLRGRSVTVLREGKRMRISVRN